MKIVVVCENMSQFKQYVNVVMNDESRLLKKTIKQHICSGIITMHTEDLEFIYCRNSVVLRGRSFSGDDRIVKIGTWYNIPVKVLENIMNVFVTRTVPYENA